MSKSKIVITAGLQINGTDGSVAQIKQDLKKITEKLNREKAFKVRCSIDTSSDSISTLQAQLDKISNKLSLSISNINIGKLDIRSIQEAINGQTKDMTVQAKVETTVDSGSVNKASQQIAKEIENATQTNIKLNEKRTQNRQYAYVFTEGSTDNILQSAKDTLNAQFKEWGTGDVATRVKRATEDSTQELQRFTVQVEKQNGATETLIYQLDEVSKRYEYLGKTIREADNSTAFRRKGVDVQKEIQGFNLDKIENQLKSYGLYTEEFEDALTSLREELVKVNDTNGINQYLDNLDIFKARISSAKTEMQLFTKEQKAFDNALNTVDKEVNSSMNSLSGVIQKSSVIFDNADSPEIQKITQEIDELISKYKILQQRITWDATPKTLSSIQEEANALQYDLDKLIDKVQSYEFTWQEAQKQQTEELKRQSKERTLIVKEIESAYKRIEKYSKVATSSSASAEEVRIANENISQYEELVNASILRLKNEGLITQEVLEQIQSFENLIIESQRLSNVRAEQKRIEKEIAEETKQQTAFDKAQHEYWQGRFSDEIKAMTAENQVLKEMKRYYEELDKAAREFDSTKNKISNSLNSTIGKLDAQSRSTVYRNNSGLPEVGEQLTQIEAVRSQYQALLNELQIADTPEALISIQRNIDQLKPKFVEVINASKNLQATLRNDSFAKSLDNKIQKLSADMNNFAIANQKAISSTKQMSGGTTFADKWIQLSKQMARGTELNADELRHLQEEFRIFGKEAETAGLKGQSTLQKFLGQFKQMTTYITAQAVWSFVKREISSMIEEVRSLDAAMINLKKVTDETDSGYDRFTQTAQKQAKQLHMTTTDVVEQTAEWAKLGYNIDQAAELAKNSMIYSKVGEVDNKTAVSDLVTSIKAFNIEASDSIEIVDKLNILGNNFSTASADLGEGLRVSSSALSAAGNDINQSLALITGGTEIIQNASQVGEALRTISMRIRSMKGELQELGEETDGIESISKIQTQILNLTKGKVNIFDDNGDFKSTYEILKEISEVWNNLNSKSRASLQEILFGKTRANQGLAILNAFQSGQIEKAYNTAIESAGSAQTEFEKMSEGIESHINSFRQAFESLSMALINSDGIKNSVDTGTAFLEVLTKIIDKFDLLPTALAGLATVGGIKGVGIFGDTISSLDDIMDRLKGITDEVSTFKSQFSASSIFKEFDINLKGLSDIDISSLQEYISLLDSDEVDSDALAKSLESASSAAKTQAMNLGMLNTAYKAGEVSQEAYTAATQSLATTQKVATATSKALAVGLNLITNLGITIAITIVVKAIDSLIHAEEKAKEKATELRKEAVEQLNAYAEETKTLKDSIKQYQEIISTTSDLATEKSKLVDIQENINSGIEQEKDKVDLLNKSLSENIELIQKQQLADAKQTVLENQAAYDTAKEAMSYRSEISYIPGTETYDMKGVRGFKTKFSQSDIDAFIARTTGSSFVRNSDYGWDNRYTYLTGTLEEQRDTLIEMMNIYKEQEDYDKEKYQILVDQKQELDAQIKDYEDIVKQYEQAQDTVSSLEIPDDVRTAFNEVLENYVTAQQELKNIEANEGSNIEIQKAQKNVQDLGNELMATAGKYVGLRDIAIQQTNAIQTGTAEVITSLEALSQDVRDNLDGSFKDTLSNVDKIKAAMQTLASGEGLDWSTVQELLFDIDTDKVLDTFKEVNGKYEFVTGNYKSLISLKDQIIKQQLEIIKGEKAEQEAALNTAQANLSVAQAKLARSQSESDAKYYKGQIADIESEIKTINGLIGNSDALIMHLNSQLGDTVSIEKAIEAQQKAIEKQQKALQAQQKALNNELKKAQENADNYAKAMTAKLDNIINGLEKEKDALSDEKELLEEQLDSLEEKKSEIEEIISQYKELVDVVKSETDKETELLKEQQKAEEDAIQARIDALKEAREQKEEETSLTEKELELQQKLADLEKARNTKVRTYSSERGWHYDVDKEAVANAQTAVDEAQQSYDKAIDDKLYNDQLSALEAEKKAVADNYEAQIQAYEDYYEQWKAILEEQENAEKEQLAEQIFGVEWREKIKNRDTTILNKFKSNFKSYNTQLNSLVNGEIASLKKSIKAKEEEIKAKEAQIESWKKYQEQVNETIERIKGKYDEYLDYLDEIKLDENSNLAERQEALANFAANYSGMIDEMNEKQLSLDAVTSEIDGLAEKLADLQEAGSITIDIGVDGEAEDALDSMGNVIETLDEWNERWNRTLDKMKELNMHINSPGDARLYAEGSYAGGGVINYTGKAQVHGTTYSSEVAFNSGQAKSLYDMVRSGDFSAMVAERAYQGFAAATHQLNYNGNTDNSNRIININGMVIKADNPAQFHDQFMREIGNYWQVKLTESRVKAPL